MPWWGVQSWHKTLGNLKEFWTVEWYDQWGETVTSLTEVEKIQGGASLKIKNPVVSGIAFQGSETGPMKQGSDNSEGI